MSSLPGDSSEALFQLGVLCVMLALHAAAFVAPSFFTRVGQQQQQQQQQQRELGLGTYFELTRVKYQANFVIFLIGFVLGKAQEAGGPPPLSPPPLFGFWGELAWRTTTTFASFSTLLYGGSVYVLNAISDVDDDRRRKPHRPLPSGKMGEAHAWCWAALNAALALASAQLLVGPALVKLYLAFLFVNGVYSFGLRNWRGGMAVPLCFITLTSPLRLLMGATVADAAGVPQLPAGMYALAFLVYVSLQFARKIVIQNGVEPSGRAAAVAVGGYWLAAGALLLTLDVLPRTLSPRGRPADGSHLAFAAVFVLASLNYFTAIFVPSMRSFVARQVDERYKVE